MPRKSPLALLDTGGRWKVLWSANNARGCTAYQVLWVRQPTEEERRVVLASMETVREQYLPAPASLPFKDITEWIYAWEAEQSNIPVGTPRPRPHHHGHCDNCGKKDDLLSPVDLGPREPYQRWCQPCIVKAQAGRRAGDLVYYDRHKPIPRTP